MLSLFFNFPRSSTAPHCSVIRSRCTSAHEAYRENKRKAVTISQRMVELMKEEQFDKALEAFKNHEKFTPERFADVVTRNQALKCCSHLGDAKTAKEIFHKMKRNFSRGSQPNLITCNILIDMYVRLEMHERVDSIFTYMLAEKIFPDTVTLTAMCAMYGKLEQPEKGDAILQVIQDCYILPDLPLVNALVLMYCTCQQPERAVQVLREMVERYKVGLDVASYSILLDCHAKRREVEKAESLLAEMVAAGIEPDLKTYTILLTMYASCHGAESLRKAKDIYAFISERPHLALDLVAYTVLIDTFTARGEVDLVRELYDSLLEKGLEPNAVIRTSVAMLGIGKRDGRQRTYKQGRE